MTAPGRHGETTGSIRAGDAPAPPRRWGLPALAALLLVPALVLSSCSSTAARPPGASDGPGASDAAGSPIPRAAYDDTTGLTPTTVSVGNVSTLSFGLFKGADIGTEAYADYIDSRGGIHGRRLVVDSYDDGFTGAQNEQYTDEAVQRDFALVGGFSLEDSFGGRVLAARPDVPNVTNSLDRPTSALPNTFSPQPSNESWGTGWFEFLEDRYPSDVGAVGDLIADQPSAVTSWGIEKATMEHVGYHVVYDAQYAITQSDFDQNVVAMRSAGVKLLFIDQMPANYVASVIRALDQQDFHPVLVLGAAAYSPSLVADSGGASAVDGAYLGQTMSLYLGEDASTVPAVSTFLSWVHKASPGFTPDLFTLYGWISAELFVQALASAGPHPTRGSVLRALRGVTSFDADGIIAASDPSAKTPAVCYLVARVEHGVFTRVDDPPPTGATHGYRCDGRTFTPG